MFSFIRRGLVFRLVNKGIFSEKENSFSRKNSDFPLKGKENRYDGEVDWKELYHRLNERWEETRAALSKEDIAYLANKDTLRGKMLGFLTWNYYKRSRLLSSSNLFFAYVFQNYSNSLSSESDYPTWLLFSPSSAINENPTILKNICAKLQLIKNEKPVAQDLKETQKLLVEYLSDVSYFELPSSVSEGSLVFLSIIDVHPRLNPNFRMGLNLILASPSVSKEVLYLPERFFLEDYKDAYRDGKLIL